MSDDPRLPQTHPEATLSSYVDGSATEEERRLVAAHLEGCATCRADVEFAVQGHAAMRALPELEGPGLVEQGLSWLPQTSRTPSAARSRRRTRGRSRPASTAWQRLAWGSGIAVAATLAAVFVFANLQGGGRPTTAAQGGGAADSRAEASPPVTTSTNYDKASLAALADRLTQEQDTTFGRAAPPAQPAPVAGGETSSVEALQKSAATRAEDCVRGAAGVPEGTPAAYLEVAEFEGTPAYIAAFRVDPTGGSSPTQLLVAAVSKTGCSVLYLVTLPL
jgi:hypothetical protein